MQAALENFRNLKAGRKKVVLGDMLELGQESQQEHGTVLQQLQSIDLDNVLLVGLNFRRQQEAGLPLCRFNSCQGMAPETFITGLYNPGERIPGNTDGKGAGSSLSGYFEISFLLHSIYNP
jgi:UDP-N-acetylmuramyl pentapeptide synthase